MELFKHNETAYRSAVKMLSEAGKAAVIHPTGTGKSFIGFKLCEDNSDKKVLWLSPSEYIFKTQLENLKKTGAEIPENVTFLTYAKLMLMSDEQIGELKPEMAVFDEYHRAGAACWQNGVERLMRAFPNMPILGLSATNIRYLDNQRDMAQELFGGNIASEMSLGEAIARGMLAPPKYVCTVYSFRKDLERYEKRIAASKSKKVRDAAGKYLKALRRALEKADGLDVVFHKNMTDRTGKYIVFCANKEHMDEMISHVPEWFAKVDDSPRVYSVYSSDPEASVSFRSFKEDKTDDHLRLLFCIDALNEGIHVDDISGVILLRPTVSPIVYKQQIGRALSAGKAKEPVIFDIVNNISGLYSISSVQEEMWETVRFYQYLGKGEDIVNENFKVIDDLKDCKRIFDDLENVLSASWEFMFEEAKAYSREFGDLLPDQKYVTASGARLGQWLVTQRINYRNGTGISKKRIEKLESIGMDWRTLHERQWDEGFALAKVYSEKHGSLDPDRMTYPKLANWLMHQRQKYREGKLADEQFESLDKIGMVWEANDSWEEKFRLAKEYSRQHGDLDIPAGHVAPDGTALGAWYRGVKRQYKSGTLSEERIKRLEEIGADWTSASERSWAQYYQLARAYYEEHKDLNVNARFATADGVRLGVWISGQRYAYKKGKLTAEQIRMLEEIGMCWQRTAGKWEEAYELAAEYADKHGRLDPPAAYTTDSGFSLGAWTASQRRKYADEKLRPVQIKRLEALGISWDISEDQWQSGIEHSLKYLEQNGSLDVPTGHVCPDGFRLGAWIANQRTKYKSGKMPAAQAEQLEKLGMKWYRQKDRWQTGFDHAAEYFHEKGDLKVSQDYVCEDGYLLSSWIASQRKAYRSGRLTDERKSLLDSLGMIWDRNSDRWNCGYSYARTYLMDGGRLPIPQKFVTKDGYPLGEWVYSQQRRYRSGRLETEKVRRLAEIGVRFD